MKIWIVIFGMMFVTYLPRLIPLLTIAEKNLPPFWRRFLVFIPFTALGALIIPGFIEATPGKPIATLAGIGTTVVIAWFNGGIILSVLAAIVVTFLMLCVQI